MTTPFQAGQRLTAAALDAIPMQVLPLAGSVTTVSTTPSTLIIATVAAATYYVEGVLECTIGATSTIPKIGFYGTATESAMLIAYSMFEESATGENILGGKLTSMASNSNMSEAVASGAGVQVRFSGTITFSAGGTFIVEAGDTTSGDHYTVQAGSYMCLTQQQT